MLALDLKKSFSLAYAEDTTTVPGLAPVYAKSCIKNAIKVNGDHAGSPLNH